MIEFSQLERHYLLGSQSVSALRGVSGYIAQGEMVALCGPSGSGKSTLLNVLGMLDAQYQGQVTFAGQPYPSGQMQAAKMRREKLGFIFQKFNLVPVMTALEKRRLSAASQRFFKNRANRTCLTNAGTCGAG